MTKCTKYNHSFLDYDCPRCKMSSEYVEDYGCPQEKGRIDNIGRNGNDGDHYNMSLEDAYEPTKIKPWESFTLNNMPQHNDVTNPKHYDLIPEKDVQVIDVIRAALTEEEFRGYCRGNQIKYVLRNKADRVEDAGKARQYIDFELEK